MAAGTNTMGLSAAGGLGCATAGWIVGEGGIPADSYDLELSRFLGLHNNRRFLRDRVKEVPGMYTSSSRTVTFDTDLLLNLVPYFLVL